MPDDEDSFPDGSTLFSTPENLERLREVLQACSIEVKGKPTLLYGFVVIAEYSTVEGRRWLSAAGGDAAARPIPYWQFESYGRELAAWGHKDIEEDEGDE